MPESIPSSGTPVKTLSSAAPEGMHGCQAGRDGTSSSATTAPWSGRTVQPTSAASKETSSMPPAPSKPVRY